MGFFRKIKTGEARSGGIAFFLSLFFLWLVATHNFRAMLGSPFLSPLRAGEGWAPLAYGVLGIVTGTLIARLFVSGTFSVFLHELKHAIVSNLSGNRAKGMVLNRSSGSFTYEYTESTRAYNAFISLAPYWFPLTQLGLLLATIPLLYRHHELLVLASGIGFGADLVLNLRDISPHQSDFSQIRGGFGVGVLYVLGMNLALTSLMLAWWLQGLQGLWLLLVHLRTVVEAVVT